MTIVIQTNELEDEYIIAHDIKYIAFSYNEERKKLYVVFNWGIIDVDKYACLEKNISIEKGLMLRDQLGRDYLKCLNEGYTNYNISVALDKIKSQPFTNDIMKKKEVK